MKKIIRERNSAGMEAYKSLSDFSNTRLSEWNDDHNLIKIFMHEFMIYLSQHLLWKIDPPNEYDLSMEKIPYVTKSFLNDPKIPHENNCSFKLVNLKES